MTQGFLTEPQPIFENTFVQMVQSNADERW